MIFFQLLLLGFVETASELREGLVCCTTNPALARWGVSISPLQSTSCLQSRCLAERCNNLNSLYSSQHTDNFYLAVLDPALPVIFADSIFLSKLPPSLHGYSDLTGINHLLCADLLCQVILPQFSYFIDAPYPTFLFLIAVGLRSRLLSLSYHPLFTPQKQFRYSNGCGQGTRPRQAESWSQLGVWNRCCRPSRVVQPEIDRLRLISVPGQFLARR